MMSENEDWSECPMGTIQRAIRIRKHLRFSNSITRTLSVALLTFLLFSIGSIWLGSAPNVNPQMAPLTCRQVETLISAYRSGAVSLSMKRRIDRHLQFCDECRMQFEALAEQNGQHHLRHGRAIAFVVHP